MQLFVKTTTRKMWCPIINTVFLGMIQSLRTEMPNDIGFVVVLVICGSVLVTAQEPPVSAKVDEAHAYFLKIDKQFKNITDKLELLRMRDNNSILQLELQNSILKEKMMTGHHELLNELCRMQDAAEKQASNFSETLNLILSRLETPLNASKTADPQSVPEKDILNMVLDEVRAIKQANEEQGVKQNVTCCPQHEVNGTAIGQQLSQVLDELSRLKNATTELRSECKARWKKEKKLLYKLLKKKKKRGKYTVNNQTNDTDELQLQCNNSSENCTKLPTSCAEALDWAGSDAASGVYKLYLPYSGLKPFSVYCLRDPEGGPAWTVIQSRSDNTTDFYRGWADYKAGFGNLNGDFFIGLNKLHALTQSQVQELWVDLEDFENQTRYAKYDSFGIGNHHQKYALTVLGEYEGDAGDSLRFQQGQKFSTRDRDHDIDERNCAVTFGGAWWYANCHASNLNGRYLGGPYPKRMNAQGIVWRTWHGHFYSLKRVHMAIRPKNYEK